MTFKVFTLREIVKTQTPVKMVNPSAITRHLIEEIGEIAGIIMRSEDPTLPTTPHKLSDIHKQRDELLLPDQKHEFARYCTFYRWNRVIDPPRFKDHLESELIDVVMMIGVYIHHLRKWVSEIPAIDELLDYRFDRNTEHVDNLDDLIDVDDCFISALGAVKHLFRIKVDIRDRKFLRSAHYIRLFGDLLTFVEDVCFVYGIDVNAGIERKLTELRNQKRSR